MNNVKSQFLKMEHEENINIKLTNNEFEKELTIYKKGFEKCDEILSKISNEAKPFEKLNSRLATCLMMPRLFMSMKSILNLVLKGYYYDSLVLLRSWMECLGLSIYLSKNEYKAQKWFKNEEIGVSSIRLMQEISGAINGVKDKSFYSIYGQLCHYIHNRIQAIYEMLKNGKEKEGRIEYIVPLYPSYNEKDAYESSFYILPLLLWTSLNKVFSLNQNDEILEYAKECFTIARIRRLGGDQDKADNLP